MIRNEYQNRLSYDKVQNNHMQLNQSRFYFFVQCSADIHIKTQTCGRKKDSKLIK